MVFFLIFFVKRAFGWENLFHHAVVDTNTASGTPAAAVSFIPLPESANR